ncbi:MAG: hypothetical protein MI784_12800, partial [Cytophagales bacterium]|nr:hypothetical protein [Cytophagales bacterium]
MASSISARGYQDYHSVARTAVTEHGEQSHRYFTPTMGCRTICSRATVPVYCKHSPLLFHRFVKGAGDLLGRIYPAGDEHDPEGQYSDRWATMLQSATGMARRDLSERVCQRVNDEQILRIAKERGNIVGTLTKLLRSQKPISRLTAYEFI